jgi:hypothetical protein
MPDRTADEGTRHQAGITVVQGPRFSAPRILFHNVSQFFSRLRVNKCKHVVETARDGERCPWQRRASYFGADIHAK